MNNKEFSQNIYRNNVKAIGIGNEFWQKTESYGLAGIVANLTENDRLITNDGHTFVNFSCCSYLDLDSHPKIIQGAIAMLQKYGVLDHCIARARIQLPALLELEDTLTNLFNAPIITALSASVATAGILPVLASGHLTHSKPLVMLFDKNCHFSMNLLKPICADETLVLTTPHNDLNFIEDVCKKYDSVAYIADGTYSMGGHAPVKELLDLQEKYGLFLYLDDSHSLSIHGDHGEGYIRSNLNEVNEKTIIVATLNKAFGASGAIIMLGPKDVTNIIERFGGPVAWSQPMNTASIGAALASAEIHRSEELSYRQNKLLNIIKLFDNQIATEQSGNLFPIKFVSMAAEIVMECASFLFKNGFYISPVFFPIVERNKAGLRVMLRTNNNEEDIMKLTSLIKDYCQTSS